MIPLVFGISILLLAVLTRKLSRRSRQIVADDEGNYPSPSVVSMAIFPFIMVPLGALLILIGIVAILT